LEPPTLIVHQQLHATCAWLGVDWVLASVVQKKGESLRQYIQRFYNERNIITEVNDKSIVTFFKKGLREPSLIQKLAMKNPMMSEEMFYTPNRYTLAEEPTLNSREQKKESDHTDQPSSSKGHDKKRKPDRSVNVVKRPHHHKEYKPRPDKFESFMYRICIFTPRESIRPETATDSKVL
jgi:hypothetical protein